MTHQHQLAHISAFKSQYANDARWPLPLNIQDCVGLIIDNVDEHVGLSVIHPAFLIHMKLLTKKVRYLRKAQKKNICIYTVYSM